MTQTKTSTVAANNQTIQDGVRHREGYKNVIIIRRKYMTRTQSSIKHESEARKSPGALWMALVTSMGWLSVSDSVQSIAWKDSSPKQPNLF